MRYGKEIGLVSSDDFDKMKLRYESMDFIKSKIYNMNLKPSSELNEILTKKNINSIKYGGDLASFIKRPEIELKDCVTIFPELNNLNDKATKK